ncbi:hypothetical protein CDL15_Pgr005290 [Punica granatum]|uniref:GTD-binding domain-containing protein n=1 Tax=Punica granatum TaxID=22663 RepID=A0A218XDS8_PUNGR|nr:hypothetical protein CDL15_Pgr005290 [Punica granatum]
MGPQASPRYWTLMGLILAFLDLGLAYFLLCASALWFFWSKFLNLFGLYVPCPCRGVPGFVDSRLCWHKLLVEIPMRNILAVQVLVRSRLPFSSIWYEEQGCGFNLPVDKTKGSENWFLDSSSEASLGLDSGLVLRSLRDRGTGDVKGKGVLSQKQQRYARRRRRVTLGNGKYSSSLRNLGSSSVTERSSVCGFNEGMRSEIGESLSPLIGIEGTFQGDEKVPFGTDMGEKSWHSFELSESINGGKSAYTNTSCAESFIEETAETVTDESNKVRMLEKALEEVKAAYNALVLELDQERSAAGTAAEEAMAMISRLQNEKASIEMEVRQNQRMVDEKLAYDEEEMNILKEILVRREMENFVLENEVETLKQMMSSSDNNSEGCPRDEDIRLAVPQVENGGMNGEKAVVRIDNSSSYRSQEDVFQSKSLESDTSTELEVLEKNGETQKCLSCDCEGSNKYGQERDNEVPQVVYDVHVVDDETEQPVRRTDKDGPVTDISLDVELIGQRSSLDTINGLEGLGSIHYSGRSLLSTVSSERLRLDSEVEWLREMLRKVQEEKEKLKLSAENRDKGRIELKLLEEIRDQLQEIQKLGKPLRHSSLPPSISKANLKRSRSQSGSGNAQESA